MTVRTRKGPVSFAWGREHLLGTSAFWIDQTRRRPPASHRLGRSLIEETACCVLGGYGMPAEHGLVAFAAVRDAGLLDASPTNEADIELVLSQPLAIGGGATIRYRFPRQRARWLALALKQLRAATPPVGSDAVLRDWLQRLPGVGPKTASWIVRNHCDSDEVAIIDTHVRRVGLGAGFFDPQWRLPRDYDVFEQAFRAVAALGDVRPSALDACIWSTMSNAGPAAPLFSGMRPRETDKP